MFELLDVLDSRFDPIYIVAACFDPNTVHLVSKEIWSLRSIVCQATSGQSTSNVQPTNELDLHLEEIAQEELEQRQSRAGIQARAKSWIGDILRRGITAKASASSSIDPLVYWQKLIDKAKYIFPSSLIISLLLSNDSKFCMDNWNLMVTSSRLSRTSMIEDSFHEQFEQLLNKPCISLSKTVKLLY
uniref:Uncharacterized protein n=1 Tax=Ditylenchus dipsaci TaxID=166011 RepID=A0A915DKR7_9BILA